MVLGAVRHLFLAASCFLLTVISPAEDQPRPARPDEIALFKAAMLNGRPDTEHWAYIESVTKHVSKRRVRGGTVVRFDPLKPYAEQFASLQLLDF